MAASVVATCSGVGNEVMSCRLGGKNSVYIVYRRQTLLTALRPAFPGVMDQIA